MTSADIIEAAAKLRYERNTNGSAPRWELLGDITKGVWRERVEKELPTIHELVAFQAVQPHLFQPPPPYDD